MDHGGGAVENGSQSGSIEIEDVFDELGSGVKESVII